MKLHPRFSIFLVFVLLVTSVLTAGAQATPAAQPYIIVFNDTVDVPAAAQALERAHGLQTGFIYEHALKGMSAMVPAGRLIALQKDPRVKYVVEDMERSISAQTVPTGIQRIFAQGNGNLNIDGTDDYRVDVDVAVIDTGVDFQHPDLNVVGGVNCTGTILTATCKTGGDDDHYHGTHVAGTIAALDNGMGVVGVAPGARIWAVKVLDKRGSGYSSWIIAGIDWVAANAATIEVANMSLGGSGYSKAEYDAIQSAVNKGVAFAVAAGNSDADANNYSPAAFDNVLTVSALADFNGLPGGGAAATCRTDVDDTLADFSNWGSAVDIAAPGVCILSTYPLEKGEYGTISGTSMASPHAAGALALLASRNNPGNAADVSNLYNQVKNAGNTNWVDDSGDGIKEKLLDVSNATLFNPVLVPGSGVEPLSTATRLNTYTPTTTVTLTPVPSATPTVTLTPVPSATSEPIGSISLNVLARVAKTNKFADLTWSPALSVDVYRNGTKVATTAVTTTYTDKPLKTITSATYKVCQAGTSICSNEMTVSW
jgi:subtilisin